jgi:hypothetical protein
MRDLICFHHNKYKHSHKKPHQQVFESYLLAFIALICVVSLCAWRELEGIMRIFGLNEPPAVQEAKPSQISLSQRIFENHLNNAHRACLALAAADGHRCLARGVCFRISYVATKPNPSSSAAKQFRSTQSGISYLNFHGPSNQRMLPLVKRDVI